jgi:hypothetical protein
MDRVTAASQFPYSPFSIDLARAKKLLAIDDAIRRFDPLGTNIKPNVREQVTTIALEVEQLV